MAVDLVHPAENIVGESIVWDAMGQRLLWIDIVGKSIHALTPETGELNSWATPEVVTSIGLCKDGGAIVGLMQDICLWDFGGTFTPFAKVESNHPGNRLNECVVGPDGSFWVGTMQNNIAADGTALDMTQDSGRLYRCTPGGQVEPLCDNKFALINTMIWPESGGLITADTGHNKIYHYDYDPMRKRLSNKRTIVSDFDRGLPDGSTLDAEGYVWNCRVAGGGCLLRFDPDGNIDRVVELPCSWPTSCTFGGESLDTLYVTSARFTMDDQYLSKNPQEGGLFGLKPGVSGLPPYRFG